MAHNGTVTNLYPPTNNGTSRGAGMIDGDTGDNLVFQTPGDNNNQVLAVGQSISYETDSHGNITSVSGGIIIGPPDGGG